SRRRGGSVHGKCRANSSALRFASVLPPEELPSWFPFVWRRARFRAGIDRASQLHGVKPEAVAHFVCRLVEAIKSIPLLRREQVALEGRSFKVRGAHTHQAHFQPPVPGAFKQPEHVLVDDRIEVTRL